MRRIDRPCESRLCVALTDAGDDTAPLRVAAEHSSRPVDATIRGFGARFTQSDARPMNDKIEPSRTHVDVERFDRWAATYDQSVMQRLYFGPVHARMLELLRLEGPKVSPSCILDVGCGTGRLLRSASVCWPEAQLVGVDPAAQMILEAARLNPKATFRLASAETLPVPDQSADLVVSSLSFHHWADQQKGLHEIARVLRPKGYFCLADHAMLLTKLLGEKVKSRDEIRALMMRAGLAVRQQQTMGIRFVLITLAQK